VAADSRAAVFLGPEAPIELQVFPLPVPAAGALVARIVAATTCGTDLHILEGRLPVPTPIVLGHEAVGVVESLGEGVSTDFLGNPVEAGDLIVWDRSFTCGHCYYCTTARMPLACDQRQTYGLSLSSRDPPHLNGFFADFVYLRPRTAFFKAPTEIPTSVLSMVNCALGVAVHAVSEAGITVDDSLLVQGAGAVGLLCVALAKEAGAGPIIVVDMLGERLQLARALGADHIIDLTQTADVEHRVPMVKQLTNGRGVDYAFEAAGSPAVLAEGLQSLRKGGTYCIIGAGLPGSAVLPSHLLVTRQLRMRGILSHEPRHLQLALDFLRRAHPRLPLERLVTAEFPLERIGEVADALRQHRVVKALVRP
jgi:threonine dehydrogenase-like Zn-dependent dehydrogenase